MRQISLEAAPSNHPHTPSRTIVTTADMCDHWVQGSQAFLWARVSLSQTIMAYYGDFETHIWEVWKDVKTTLITLVACPVQAALNKAALDNRTCSIVDLLFVFGWQEYFTRQQVRRWFAWFFAVCSGVHSPHHCPCDFVAPLHLCRRFLAHSCVCVCACTCRYGHPCIFVRQSPSVNARVCACLCVCVWVVCVRMCGRAFYVYIRRCIFPNYHVLAHEAGCTGRAVDGRRRLGGIRFQFCYCYTCLKKPW